MGDISDRFVKEMMGAMPDHWDTGEQSANRTIAKAIGDAMEKTFEFERQRIADGKTVPGKS